MIAVPSGDFVCDICPVKGRRKCLQAVSVTGEATITHGVGRRSCRPVVSLPRYISSEMPLALQCPKLTGVAICDSVAQRNVKPPSSNKAVRRAPLRITVHANVRLAGERTC